MDVTAEVSASAAGDIAWSPSAERIADARISEFIDWLQATGRFEATSYQSLWEWSVTTPYPTPRCVGSRAGEPHRDAYPP